MGNLSWVKILFGHIIRIEYHLLTVEPESCPIYLFAAIPCNTSICTLLCHTHLFLLEALPKFFLRVLKIYALWVPRLLNPFDTLQAIFHRVQVIVEDTVTFWWCSKPAHSRWYRVLIVIWQANLFICYRFVLREKVNLSCMVRAVKACHKKHLVQISIRDFLVQREWNLFVRTIEEITYGWSHVFWEASFIQGDSPTSRHDLVLVKDEHIVLRAAKATRERYIIVWVP